MEALVSDDFVTMKEAQEILGVSKFTVWRLVRDGKLTAYQSEVDRREKLVRRGDLEALRKPRPLPVAPEKAVA